MILLVDNYDSFTYNLAQYIGEFDTVTVLIKSSYLLVLVGLWMRVKWSS